MCSSIREFGFKIPVLARSDGEVVDGHLRLKAARKLGSWPGGDTSAIPVILCDEWTPAQVKAFRLMVNRSVAWASWDEELLALELRVPAQLSKALAKANPQYPAEASYMKHRTEGHNETSISGDTRADAPGTPQRLPRYGSGPPGTTATQRSTVRRERLSSKQYVKRVFQEKTKRCISSAARRPPAVGRNTGRRSRHGRYVASIANWPLDPHGSAPVAPKTHPWSIAPTASN
jgi:hypothetical protein